MICFAQYIKNYIYIVQFYLGKTKPCSWVKRYYNTTKIFSLIELVLLVLWTCRDYNFRSGSRCNKLLFALPRKIRSWATRSRKERAPKCLNFEKDQTAALFSNYNRKHEVFKLYIWIFEMFRNQEIWYEKYCIVRDFSKCFNPTSFVG